MTLAPPLYIVQQCRALEPGWAGLPSQAGLVGWLVQLPLCQRFFNKKKQNKKITNIARDLLIPLVGRVFSFSNRFGTGCLTFPWTGWFRIYQFWDGLQFFLPFNSRSLDGDGQKLYEKSAVHTGSLSSVHSWT
jgi:hypothetical protein